MIIKLKRIISCSTEHPSYPASNLLEYRSNSSWRCEKPGCMIANVIFEFAEPSWITGLDIGNYRSCVVIVTASTSADPDNWIPIVNHQFLSNDDAADGKFKDQVQIFTKNELNPDVLKQKFDRAKVTCMQPANLKELFGLSFLTFKTKVQVDLFLDVFGRFKMKPEENKDDGMGSFREKYMKHMGNSKKTDYKSELLSRIKEQGINNFSKRQEVQQEPAKRPLLEKLEAGKTDEVFGTKTRTSDASSSKQNKTEADVLSFKSPESSAKNVKRTPFGDIVPTTSVKNDVSDSNKNNEQQKKRRSSTSKDSEPGPSNAKKQKLNSTKNHKITEPTSTKRKQQEIQKLSKPFSKLLDDVIFVLSGYVNPQRDQIRKKALAMGADYIVDTEKSRKKCTHLICAFKNTPKYQQLKGKCKIVSHDFIEECFNEKKRFPWRRYALDSKDKAEPESEEEIVTESTLPDSPVSSPNGSPNIFDAETDPDSDSNY